MGNQCFACFDEGGGYSTNSGSSSVPQEDPETRRQRQAEAALKRQKEIEGRGLKNPEAVKAKQKRREEIEKKAEAQGNSGDSALRWTVD